jgi:hypothetical protein
MNRICFFSSFIFLTNVILNFYYKEYVYAGLFLGLFFTSLIVHSNNTFYANLFDKIFIISVVFYGGYVYFKKIHKDHDSWISVLPFVFFLSTIFLYVYGYFVDDFCFNKKEEIANYYHALLHICGSVGHHFIVLL